MPRIARKDCNTSFFHIMVQGIRKDYIFESNYDKKKYLEIMNYYLSKYMVKIISYCIMDNHAHILVYFEKLNDISEYMRSVNTTYAMYYNKAYKKTGYVFRDRYKVEPIYSEKYLINCINYIHDNPIKAKICTFLEEYKYSSYYEYRFNVGKIIKESKKRFQEINDMFMDEIFKQQDIDYSYMDYEEEVEYENKIDILENFIKENKIGMDEIIQSKECLKIISKKLSEKCGMTHQEIADEFGINRLRITRLINSE